MKYTIPIAILYLAFTISCTTDNKSETTSMEKETLGLSISKESYGSSPEGEAFLYTLRNQNGMMMKVTNYGGIVTELHVPDKEGTLTDVTHGFDSIGDYQRPHPNFGALIGRYGNRIAKGRFSIDDQEYTLALNNGPNALHGGIDGFSRRLWKATTIEAENQVGLEFSRRSQDMEEGYPGNLDVTVRYLLNNNNEWIIEYEATTDKKTTVNLTQHAYFNLQGHNNGDILEHELMINADKITPVDETLIPTGELMDVEGTPFDFRKPTAVGARVNDSTDQQIAFGNGYDHNYVLNRKTDGDLELAATLFDKKSGRFMEVLTTEPGVQFYCGNFLNGKNIGKGGVAYQQRSGLCLETQHFPDSPNQESFPSTILEPGEVYKTTTVYRFSTK